MAMKHVRRIDQLSNNILEIGLGALKTVITSTADELKIEKQLNLSGNKLVNIGTPTADTDAANKKYVDDAAAAVKVAVMDDGAAKGDIQTIDFVDADSLVKAAVTVEDGKAVVTMNHAIPSGGTATTNSGAVVIANVTRTDDGHITNVETQTITTELINAQPAEDTLTALGTVGAGMVAKTGEGTVAAREIVAGNGVTVTNGTGVNGNPTIAVADASTTEKGIVQLSDATDSTSSTTAATSAAVKAVNDAKLNLAGGTMTGELVLEDGSAAVSKDYVDSVAQGLNIHDAVRVATTEAITLSGLQTIDGVTLVAGDRVLVKDNTAAENGVYVVADGAWTRAEDANEGSELTSYYVFVLEGVENGGFGYNQTATVGTVGTDAQTWVVFNKPAEYSVKGTDPIVVAQSGKTFTVSAKAASTSQAGVVQLYNGADSNSTELAVTAAALKAVKDSITAVGGDAASKVSGAVEGNLAGLDATGNLTDSGVAVLAGEIAANEGEAAKLVSAKQVADYVAAEFEEHVTGAEVKTLKMAVGTATANSVTELPAGAVILSCHLVVETAYSEGATIAITAGGTEIMPAAYNDPTQVANYEGTDSVVAASKGNVTATVTGSPAAGAGYVVVTFSETALA